MYKSVRLLYLHVSYIANATFKLNVKSFTRLFMNAFSYGDFAIIEDFIRIGVEKRVYIYA